MTAAYRLRGIGWFGSCVAVVLGFYLVSLQVAAERKKLDDVNGRIAAAQRDIRALETEFDTRANLVQLEKWNGDTLALTAPVAGQFVGDEAQLASLDVTRGPAESAVQTAALLVPSQPAPVVVQPDAVAAAATPAAPAKPNAPAPVVRLAKVDLPKPQIVQARVRACRQRQEGQARAARHRSHRRRRREGSPGGGRDARPPASLGHDAG